MSRDLSQIAEEPEIEFRDSPFFMDPKAMDVEGAVIKNVTPSVNQIEVADPEPASKTKSDRKFKQQFLTRKPSNIY